MDTVEITFSLPPELVEKLDKIKERDYKDIPYEEMLSQIVKRGLQIVEYKKKALQGKP